jgi:hypothetical protein
VAQALAVAALDPVNIHSDCKRRRITQQVLRLLLHSLSHIAASQLHLPLQRLFQVRKQVPCRDYGSIAAGDATKEGLEAKHATLANGRVLFDTGSGVAQPGQECHIARFCNVESGVPTSMIPASDCN